MPDLYSKITLTIIAIAFVSITLRPSGGTDAVAAAANDQYRGDPAFKNAVAWVVNNYCKVSSLPKGDPQHNLEVTCIFNK